MKVKWLGHSCFLLTSENGVRVLTDPFNDKVGYPVPRVEADLVTVSHQHFDHNNTAVVLGRFTVFDTPGSFNARGIEIHGYPTFHDSVEGQQRGNNVLYKISIDGIQIVHCGDLGHVLTHEQAEGIGEVHVLMLPVGGTYTIGATEAAEMMRLLRPAITVPMHYKTEGMSFPIQPVDTFLKIAGGGWRAGTTEIDVTMQALERLNGVVVLDYPC
jgi:L-ascorbate metabolism protein UlaG (beta-lactamase superfamily)